MAVQRINGELPHQRELTHSPLNASDQQVEQVTVRPVDPFAAACAGLCGDDDVRPKFPGSPAELSTLGEPTYRLHQALIALRRRNPWLLDARTEAVKLENKHFVYRSTSADAQHSLTVDLNIEQSPTFTIRNADGSTAYQW